MAERAAKRPSGVSRVVAQPRSRQAELLASIDVSGFTTVELQRALADRGLSTAGTDAELRDRLTQAIADDYAAAGA